MKTKSKKVDPNLASAAEKTLARIPAAPAYCFFEGRSCPDPLDAIEAGIQGIQEEDETFLSTIQSLRDYGDLDLECLRRKNISASELNDMVTGFLEGIRDDWQNSYGYTDLEDFGPTEKELRKLRPELKAVLAKVYAGKTVRVPEVDYEPRVVRLTAAEVEVLMRVYRPENFR